MGQRHFKQIKKYVVLQYLDGPDRGACFWTTARPSGADNTYGYETDESDARLVLTYREVAFTDDSQEAIDLCARRGRPLLQEEAS
jgi:hypothetical protein